jgi:hypothetical protein
MKTKTIAGVISISIFLAGCGKSADSAPASPAASPSPSTVTATGSASAAVSSPALEAWGKGDKSAAVDDFVGADWNARPLFPAGSKLALTDAERTGSQADMSATLNALRELVKAVMQAGRDAASKGDIDRASKCFTAVKACGTAFDKQENLVMLIRLGQSFQRDADRELRGLGK